MVFAVSHQRHGDAHPEPRHAAAFGKSFERQQEQRRSEHQRPVGHGDKAVELEHQRRGRKHHEQRGIPAVRIRRADDAPQNPEVEGLEHGEEEPHAQFAAEEVFPGPDQQSRHGRMVEIAPCEPFGEHVVIGFVVGEFRQPGLQEVAHPPHGKPQEHQPIGVQRSVYFFERCFHSSGQRYKEFPGFAQPGALHRCRIGQNRPRTILPGGPDKKSAGVNKII